jgi:hypothetical protein
MNAQAEGQGRERERISAELRYRLGDALSPNVRLDVEKRSLRIGVTTRF